MATGDNGANAHWETLMARDGHEFGAWLSKPADAPRGAVVVLQEIFGVNPHIRSVADRFAAAGYLAIAPALFDRVDRGRELGYTPDDVQRGLGLRLQVTLDQSLLDIGAAVNVVKHAGRVATIGYCWGGQLSWVCASALQVNAAIGYYASRIWEQIDRTPACPVLLHFGTQDLGIPVAEVNRVHERHPAAEVHFYEANHGFACDARASFDAPSTALAWERTQAFLQKHIG
jgi:carboxymethylenebutenolidase